MAAKSVAVKDVTPQIAANKDNKEKWHNRWTATQEFIIKHWLPLIFAVAIIWALAWPVPGAYLVHITVAGNVRIVQEVAMGVVFFLSGLALNTQDVKKAKGHVGGVVFGFVSILFITPLLGFAMREIPLEPQDFAIGLTIFCVVPTTLGIGVALVRSCKGNDGIALLMTVGTNLLGVVTMPLMLKFLFLDYNLNGVNVTIDILNLFVKLVITILVPSVIGKALRDLIPAVARFATKHKVPLGMLSTTCLAFIVWQTLSGARDLLFESQAGMVISVIVLAATVYLVYLLLNYLIITLLFRMPTPEAISVIIMSSQKSAPVAVTVISYITGDPATQGLLAIPAIVGQLAQIFLGSAMTPPIAKRAEAYAKLQKQKAAEAALTGLPSGDQAAAALPGGQQAAGAGGDVEAAVPSAPSGALADREEGSCSDGSLDKTKLDLAAFKP